MLKEQVIFIDWPILPTFSPSRVLLTKEQLVSVDEKSNFLQESFDCVEISAFIFIFKQFYRQLEKKISLQADCQIRGGLWYKGKNSVKWLMQQGRHSCAPSSNKLGNSRITI